MYGGTKKPEGVSVGRLQLLSSPAHAVHDDQNMSACQHGRRRLLCSTANTITHALRFDVLFRLFPQLTPLTYPTDNSHLVI